MSPEQAQGKDVDSRSDVFSFGILLYRMFTGELPFTGKTQVSILARILETQPDRPSLKNEAIPAELERIIDKCLQKDANDRYQDTRDLVVDLRRLRRDHDSGVTATITGATAAVQAAAAKPRSKWKLVLGALALVIISAALIVAIFDIDPQRSGAIAGGNGLAILGFENKTGDEGLNWLETGLPEILLTDLSQSTNANLIGQRRVLDRLGRDALESSQSQSMQDYAEAAQSLGATSILSGSFYKVGELIRIDAHLTEISSGKIIHGEKVIGSNPLLLVDSLTRRVAAALNVEQTEAAGTRVADVTTASPEAYKHYHLGLEEFLNGRYEEAVAQFEEAINFDSTFALAYMRIGMARQFQGRPQEASHHLALAKELEHRLPSYDRNLLDIYADLWLNQQFDQAVIKLRTLVGNYPDDKEAKSMLAVVEGELSSDTARAFELLDQVLEQDPGFRMALNWYSQIHNRYGHLDKAVQYTEQLLRYHPDSYDARVQLAGYYTKQSRLSEALAAYEQILQSHPNDSDALQRLRGIALRQRDFAGAEQYLERIAAAHSDDPYVMIDHYAAKAGLMDWQGKFLTGIDFRRLCLHKALETGDSSLVQIYSSSLATYLRRFEMKDSALKYVRLGAGYARGIDKLNYPINLVEIAPELADSARPLFDAAMQELRAKLPAELWGLVDGLEATFEGAITHDTALVIKGLEQIIEQNLGGMGANHRALGQNLIHYGEYARGIEIISRFVRGEDQTISGYQYPHCNYLLGLGYEGLGDIQAAKEHYSEMLKYWGEPEIEIEEIIDARERLARLQASS
jgi:tetratricopeptide (TPR) repeat protein